MAKKTESKASIIRRRYAELGGARGCVQIIAAEVACDPAYVRIVARQRIHAGKSKADMKYEKQPGVQKKISARKSRHFQLRYHGDPEYRAMFLARAREVYYPRSKKGLRRGQNQSSA